MYIVNIFVIKNCHNQKGEDARKNINLIEKKKRFIGPISLVWRLGGDSSLRWLPQRLLETSPVSGESREIHTCSNFFLETFLVSSRSISETSLRR